MTGWLAEYAVLWLRWWFPCHFLSPERNLFIFPIFFFKFVFVVIVVTLTESPRHAVLVYSKCQRKAMMYEGSCWLAHISHCVKLIMRLESDLSRWPDEHRIISDSIGCQVRPKCDHGDETSRQRQKWVITVVTTVGGNPFITLHTSTASSTNCCRRKDNNYHLVA